MAVGLHLTPSASAELLPEQVVIVANKNRRESLGVAQHYAEQRGIPSERIVSLDLPSDETIGREDFERRIVRPLRQALEAQGLQASVRLLVTVYGVPLRVGPPRIAAADRELYRDASAKSEEAKSRLAAVEREMHQLAARAGAPLPNVEPIRAVVSYEREVGFLLRVAQAVDAVITRAVQVLPGKSPDHGTLESLMRRYQGLAGVTELRHRISSPASTSGHDPDPTNRLQQAEGLHLLLDDLELPIRQGREDFYRHVGLIYGLYGEFALAVRERLMLSDELADASVDSELSLLWWDRRDAAPSWRQPNPFYHGFRQAAGGSRTEIPVLLVARLDAPSADLAMRLVDRAIEAEQQGLRGTVYLDARGLPAHDPSDTSGRYDQSVRDLHAFVTQHTTYQSKLDNTEARFERPGQAPDVALYFGWYRLRHYDDAFIFRPGAIGYHMASAEAVSLHQPGETGWCKNALERGITATVGSVGEPYLDAFPEPLEFAALLLTGQYSLVETFALTSRWISWRMVLVGDPLYNPWKRRPMAKRSALTMFPLAPIAPSDRTFKDPLRARADRQRMYEQSRLRLDAILASQEQAVRRTEP